MQVSRKNSILVSSIAVVPISMLMFGASGQNKPVKSPPKVTYYERVAGIVANKCVECHRSGGVGPFSLTTMKDVVSHAPTLAAAVEKGTMPPWFAAPPEAGKASCWVNDKSLSADEKRDLVAWLKSDHPAGNAASAPVAKKYDDTWQIGKPDMIVQIPKSIAVKADGFMPYQLAFVPSGISEDRWVSALEILPTSRAVVHHVLVFVMPERGSAPRQRPVLGSGHLDVSAGFFAAYVPGNGVLSYPDGFAKKLPKNCNLIFQIHYTPNGKATEDQVRLGMIFSKTPPKHAVETYGIANRFLSIPPGDANHVETASVKPPVNVSIIGFAPHMHVRGKAFKYELETPDGKRTTLLDVPRYDFNWQLYYRPKVDMLIPAGSKMVATAVYDNSKKNLANPDPTRTVPWGDQTYDEMMLGYVEYYQTDAVVQTAAKTAAK
ncbi:MAG: alkyl hydroperoxide reductase [Chthonomonadales bacterium]